METTFTPYETAMQRLGTSLNNTLSALGRANRGATADVVATNLHRSSVQLRAAAVKLAKIAAPDSIVAAHNALIKGVRQYANDLDGLAAKLRNGSPVTLLGTIPNMKGIKQMQNATTAISKAGYVIA
jgi:hypothetical protein